MLLAMLVTACSAARSWSKGGHTFVPHRNAIGIETSQDTIFVQQNDPDTRSQRSRDIYVEELAKQCMLSGLGSGRVHVLFSASTPGQP
jgi:hypothetical protein